MKNDIMLVCESKQVQKGRVIARYCGTDNVEEAKKNFLNIVKYDMGIVIIGGFDENFKIKEIIKR